MRACGDRERVLREIDVVYCGRGFVYGGRAIVSG